MRTNSKMAILLFTLLAISIVANVHMSSAEPSSDSANVGKPNAELVNQPVTLDSLQGPAGPAGSGWKPDVNASNNGISNDINPSIGTYIDAATGAVKLYIAYVRWHPSTPWGARYEGWIARSDNRGATWWNWWHFWWDGARGILNPSLAVNAYNGTVFVATEFYPSAGGDHGIDVWRFQEYWKQYYIDDDADDDRSPSLVSEYSWGTLNYLHVSYEFIWTSDDRDLMYGRSTDWGKTWTTVDLRGGAGPDIADVFTQSDIAFSQRNLYIAYRHSTDYSTLGHIEAMYSTDYGASFLGPFEVSGTTKIDAWEPSIAGSRVGASKKPTTLWVAFRNASGAPTFGDIFVSWSKDYGNTWSSPGAIASTSNDEAQPQLSVDGMGTESMNVPGRFHLVYWTSESAAPRYNGIYYTQIADYEPSYYPAPSVYYFWEGWSTPQGQIIDNNGFASAAYNTPTITTFTRTVGLETLWVPGVAWTDYRGSTYDIYFTTLDTMFTVSYYPSTQSVVAGGSLSFYITVTLNSGTTATATLDITGPLTYHAASAHVWGHTFSPPTLTPTATSLLTFNTANYIGAGTYYLNASAVIGGYRRYATVTFTVVAAPTLTLNINPSTVARGQKLTISGQLTPGMTTTIYIYYRYPHATGSWALATTLPTLASGAYSVTATVPNLPTGIYDLIAVWFNPANGYYAASPIRVLTIT